MLRAKAVKFREEGARTRDKLLTSTDAVFKAASIPLVDVTINTLNSNTGVRKVIEKVTGIHHGLKNIFADKEIISTVFFS